MMAALRSLWIWTASIALVALWTPLLAAVRLTDRHPMRLRTGRWFRRLGRVLARVHPCRVKITGAEHVDPRATYVVVSNHQSLADIPLISHLCLDTKWLAKAELFRVPLAGWMMRMAGDVPVARGHRRQAAQALLHCARYLRQGCSVVFFPEGTRSRDGRLLPFSEAPFQLAVRERVPVLPLAVEGTGALLPPHTWVFMRVGEVRLHILEPLAPAPNVGETARARIQERLGG
jgi:1-acyl-sn-glycerol-3-phosphate acyltransferase